VKRIVFYSLAALLIVSIHSAAAAVFERDWHTPGDGLLTYDDVHRREWLDLSVSRMDQFPEPWLENAVAQIAPGELFDGFQWAKRDDVISFAESAGIDTTTLNPFITNNEIAVTGLIELLSVTYQSSQLTRSIGFIDEYEFGQQSGAIFKLNANPITGEVALAGLSIGGDDLLGLGSSGLMLYRVVPEPTTCTNILLCLCIQSLFRRSRRKYGNRSSSAAYFSSGGFDDVSVTYKQDATQVGPVSPIPI
jgi:hypothetical protein